MTNITVSATFTKNGGQPATGLTKADINLYLTAAAHSDGAETLIWNPEIPTIEYTGMGKYAKVYTLADFTTYDYIVRAQYTGATALDKIYTEGEVYLVEADTRQIEGVDATDQIRDSVLTDATRFAGADIATIKGYIDTEIAAILAAVDTEVAAIKAKTDNLPTDPADESSIQGTLTTIAGYIDTEVASILAAVDTEVAAIKAKTDNLPTDPADESNTQAAITAVLAAIAALNNPSTAAIVTAIFAGTMEGRAFEEIIKDIWAQVVGDFVANDDDDPTSIVYEGPNGATQLTHAITDTTRSWS